jgi:Putative zinc-finger
METVMDKEMLGAFVDGALSPEDAAAVVMHLSRHPADQAYVDDLFAANAALAAAFAGPLSEPVPAAIMAVFAAEGAAAPEAAKVVPLRPRHRLAAWAGGAMALAAGLAVVALLNGGRQAAPQGFQPGLILATDAVAGVLQTEASGVARDLGDGRAVMVLASFMLQDGRFCREVELITADENRVDYAVACRADEGWRVAVAMAEPLDAGQDTGFVTASGQEAQALRLFLERDGAAAPLDPQAEAAAIANNWAMR